MGYQDSVVRHSWTSGTTVVLSLRFIDILELVCLHRNPGKDIVCVIDQNAARSTAGAAGQCVLVIGTITGWWYGEGGLTTSTVGGISPGLGGVIAMSLAAAILTVHDTGTKILLETYAVNQILGVRQIFGLVLLTLIIQFSSSWSTIRVINRSAVAWRSLGFIMSTVLIASSLNVLPIATVLAIVFASPLVVALLSVPFLGEHVGPWRWGAIFAGFVGVLIILRPADPSFNLLLLLPVAAAVASGGRDLITRWAGRTDSTLAILFWSNVAFVIAAGITLPFNWKSVAPADYALIFGTAILNTMAHFLMIYALRVGAAALVSPFRYTAFVWAIVLGYLVWGDVPDQWTLIGSGVIIASGIVLAIRESRSATTMPKHSSVDLSRSDN